MIMVNVCVGTSCHLNGSYNVVQTFQQLIEEYKLHDKVELGASFCMKECQNKGVSVSIENVKYQVKPESAIAFFMETILKKARVNTNV